MPDDIVTNALARANASAAEMRKPKRVAFTFDERSLATPEEAATEVYGADLPETKPVRLRRVLAEIYELCEQALNNSQSLAEAADVLRLIERKVEEAERATRQAS